MHKSNEKERTNEIRWKTHFQMLAETIHNHVFSVKHCPSSMTLLLYAHNNKKTKNYLCSTMQPKSVSLSPHLH